MRAAAAGLASLPATVPGSFGVGVPPPGGLLSLSVRRGGVVCCPSLVFAAAGFDKGTGLRKRQRRKNVPCLQKDDFVQLARKQAPIEQNRPFVSKPADEVNAHPAAQ